MTESISPKQALLEAIQFKPQEESELKFPFILVLHSFLYSFYDNAQQRIQVLEDICAHHNEYLKDVNIQQDQKSSILLECESLVYYAKIVEDLLTDTGRRIFYNTNKDTIEIPRLEQIIYLQNLPTMDQYLEHYIAFIEGYGLFAERPVKVPTTSVAVLQCKNCLNTIFSEDIFAFCRHLFCGEAVRRYEIGERKNGEILNIHTFDVSFRNKCFDRYISIRSQKIGQELSADNDRLYPPTNIDCLNRLLEESKCAVNREEQFEQFRGSIAYEKLYYVGRPDVLKMSQYFVLYLSDKISSLSTSANPTKIEHHYHDHSVHEDYSKNLIVK